MLTKIKNELFTIKNKEEVSDLTLRQANMLYINGLCQLLTVAQNQFDFSVDDEFNDFRVRLLIDRDNIKTSCNCKSAESYCHHSIAGLMELTDYLRRDESRPSQTGKAYTRDGMIKRVLAERRDKAQKADYSIEFAENPYGEHELINEKHVRYKLTFREIEKEYGYCSCPDYRTNKLGTCKHLMFAFNKYKSHARNRALDKFRYPFVEIHLDPLNDYRISWFYPHPLPPEIKALIERYFGKEQSLSPLGTGDFLQFLNEASEYKQINIRPEVHDVVERYFDEQILQQVRERQTIDHGIINADLFPYQKEGIEFAAFRKNAIIADEMGLGKTIEAIGVAVHKKTLFDFKRTLIICPASIKDQWKREIERFSNEKAIIAEGFPGQREKIYRTSDAYFIIINYETVLRDKEVLIRMDPDFIILDEAQRIKNYETLTANAIKALPKKHALVITGTPIENRLTDLYSIVSFLDPYLLSPLWEFSYQHCYFDLTQKNKITGYYNLRELKKRLRPLLLRREKREVMEQLPNISQMDVPINMHPKQATYHRGFAKGVASILRKKYISPFDMQKLMLLLSKMRMVCDSTYLIDQETNISPKLEELEYILLEKLDIHNSDRKIVIFSEWVRMNHIIGRMLRANDIGFVELSGKVPVQKRARLIREFEENPDCRVFLSTEAGGAGLNLQVADTVINFELPWNPAKKNQRIGRIDRVGQKNKNLTVINLVMKYSIETKIVAGLEVKQQLFDGVLSEKSTLDRLDISQKGRAQFLRELESAIDSLAEPPEKDVRKDEEKAGLLELATEAVESGSSTERKEPVKTPVPGQVPGNYSDQLAQVMNQGMAFLSGLMKMATGQDLNMKSNAIEVDPNTGEVVMRFQLPVVGNQTQ